MDDESLVFFPKYRDLYQTYGFVTTKECPVDKTTVTIETGMTCFCCLGCLSIEVLPWLYKLPKRN